MSLYWDYQNVRVSPEQANILLSFAKAKGRLGHKRVYSDWQHENQSCAKALAGLGFNRLNVSSLVKNSVDNRLIADCIAEVSVTQSPDIFILVSGDGDFASLVHVLRRLGKKIIVFAQIGNANKKLTEIADEFYFVNDFLI